VLAGGYASPGVEFSAFRSVLIKRGGESHDNLPPQPSNRNLSLSTAFLLFQEALVSGPATTADRVRRLQV